MADAAPAKPIVAVLGTGAVATVLALALAEAGYPVRAIVSRNRRRASRLARHLPAAEAATPTTLPDDLQLLCCCVPDDALPSVAERLLRLPRRWDGCTVLHTSGAVLADVFEPLAGRGAHLLSFHPVQTFTPASTPAAFRDIYIGLEGDAAALPVGEQVARDLGAQPVVIEAAAKARYHLAAVLAANAFVALQAVAGEVLTSIGLSAETGAALLRPLVATTWANLQQHSPEEALTGPIVRGDQDTLERHLATLQADLPHLLPVYAALTTETVRLAVRSGRLTPEAAEALLDQLHQALHP